MNNTISIEFIVTVNNRHVGKFEDVKRAYKSLTNLLKGTYDKIDWNSHLPSYSKVARDLRQDIVSQITLPGILGVATIQKTINS